MKTSDFDYDLPDQLIAYYPEKRRTQSRLITVSKKDKAFLHKRFYDLLDYLKPGDLMVLNNTKVIPAKLSGKTETRENLEVMLVQKIDEIHWEIMVKRPKQNMQIEFQKGIVGEVKKNDENSWIIKFNNPIDSILWDIGDIPLPPYIEREAEELDKITYQTVYAAKEGAIAAPTAGLHFDKDFLERIKSMGIEIKYITLHVGIGTFRPVKGDLENHKMHSEIMEVSDEVAISVNEAKKNGRRIIAVGTTVVRALESADTKNGKMSATYGNTDLFIKPPYNFKFTDAILTNFHLPRSTLLMLVSAFAGREFILSAYNAAVENKYRFLSYGDAMFIY